MLRSLLYGTTVAMTLATAALADPLPADLPIPQAIDTAVSARLDAEGISPAPSCDDATFLRRVTLDLAGRIPTLAELRALSALDPKDMRATWVEQFLDSPDFAFHLRNELDLLLLARIQNDNDWRNYLLEATKENRSWDRLFREIMLPEHELAGQKGPTAFLRERVRELDDITNDTAVLFFGVNIGCAKCHDHPLVADWEQDHYFGLAAFFKRTYRTKAGFLAERFDGDLQFTNIVGTEKTAQFMFLSGANVEPPPLEWSDEEKQRINQAIQQAEKQDDAESPPNPDFSPRSELVALALADSEKNFFARNIVNRTWARLMGRGIVHPLDQMHSENPPSHPELLDWLARDLVDHGYDLKRLIRGIVLSESYQRDSRWPLDSKTPAPEFFAVTQARALTPRQLSLSLIVATTNPEQISGINDSGDWGERRGQLEDQANGFADQIEIPGDGFQVSVEEALLFSNNQRIENDYLRDAGDRLVGYLNTMDDPSALIDAAFLAVLSREADPEERVMFSMYLAEREDRRDAALQQLTWALLTSPGFRFNY